MLRRVVAHSASLALPRYSRWVAIDTTIRDNLTKHLTSLKEECKGQCLDLADMNDAAKVTARAFQDCAKRGNIDDIQFKGKMATLSASVKAYNTRLSNLQNEARSIQGEVDALLKVLWGTEHPQSAKFSAPLHSTSAPPANSTPASDTVDSPQQPPPVEERPAVEHVEAEPVVRQESSSNGASGSNSTEMEVETIEIEVPDSGESSPADSMKITDITKELFEEGVNFSDCLDASSLRQRYKDFLSGKVEGTKKKESKNDTTKNFAETLSPNTEQPRMPAKPTTANYNNNQYQQNYSSPPNNDTGLAYDPYPNAQRRMVDPMKQVWEVKAELAAEQGIDANAVDLWSGKVRLEDHKRLYDYPSVQNYPIEVRQKGDIPR